MFIMKDFNKKTLAGILAGVMVFAGSALLLDSAQAADQPAAPGAASGRNMPPRFNLNTAASRLAADCNVDSAQVVSYCNNGGRFHEACYAAHIAKLSGKSFETVVQAKSDSNTWEQVADGLGVTQEMLRADRCTFMAGWIAEQGNISENDALQLLQEGYRGFDVETAAAVAKAANKDVRDVLALKKLNNSWYDVGRELGVEESVLQAVPGCNPPGNGRHHNRWNDGRHHGQGGYGPGFGPGDGSGPAANCPVR